MVILWRHWPPTIRVRILILDVEYSAQFSGTITDHVLCPSSLKLPTTCHDHDPSFHSCKKSKFRRIYRNWLSNWFSNWLSYLCRTAHLSARGKSAPICLHILLLNIPRQMTVLKEFPLFCHFALPHNFIIGMLIIQVIFIMCWTWHFS